MSAAVIKGWCPGALRPMMSGDGLVVRVRPRLGRLTAAQTKGLAALADQYGNGALELSNRANVQLRGVQVADHPALIDGLRALELVDQTEAQERRRNIIVHPFWQMGDETHQLTLDLTEALLNANFDLPAKFGFAVDTGARPVLQDASADIRLERGAGQLRLIADGFAAKPVAFDTAIQEALALANWFETNRGEHRRMRALLTSGISLPEGFEATSAPQNSATGFAAKPPMVVSGVMQPQRYPVGTLVGVPLGKISAETFAQLGAIRLTPWRMLLVEGTVPNAGDLITDSSDPRLRIVTCPGAPSCAQGQGDTRDLATHLAAKLPEGTFLHITGCAKNCAHPGTAPLTLTATAQGYDLARGGQTTHTGLTPDQIEKAL